MVQFVNIEYANISVIDVSFDNIFKLFKRKFRPIRVIYTEILNLWGNLQSLK